MRLILIGAATAILAGAAITPASADCTCRGRGGIEAFLGETVCLPTSSGTRLARCEMVLNNPSWKFLDKPCPQASLDRLSNVQTAQSSHPPGQPAAR
jgi:hypothetical protein